jgi:hypothetical protein
MTASDAETDGTTSTETSATANGVNEAVNTEATPADQGAEAKDAPADQKRATDGEPEKKQTAPESYDLKAPEGFEVNADVTAAYAGVAKEAGLSQEAAQTLFEKMAPVIASQNESLLEVAAQGWKDAQKTDKEFGGDKLDENLAVAKKAMDAFATPELAALLETSRLGEHPDMIRLFYRVGKQLSEDRIVTGSRASGNDTTGFNYPSMKKE